MNGVAPRCRALGCPDQRAPELPLCRTHWRRLPRELRRQVAWHYRFGQTVEPALVGWPWSHWAGQAVIAAMTATTDDGFQMPDAAQRQRDVGDRGSGSGTQPANQHGSL